MSEMYFKNVMIADIKNHTARFQKFERGFNVITSTDNHVGKSSLLKSLYYAMGAEVEFDTVWDKNTKIYAVEICVNNQDYKIVRFQKNFAVFDEEKLIMLTRSVSRDLAQQLENIFDFSIYLPNKQTKRIEMAPPAFTFLPYYIDQDKGWSGLYDSFSSIDQYKKNDRIKSLYYHLNLYNKNTVELLARKDQLKDEIEELKLKAEKIRITLESLAQETQNLLPAESIDELERNLQIPKERIAELVGNIGEVRNKIQTLETSLHQHEHQLGIVKEYQQMKKDSQPESKGSIHTCPNCGYTFDEEIYDIVRSNYNLRNEEYMCQQIQLIINSIVEKLEKQKEQYVDLMKDLEEQEKAFDESQDTYETYIRQRGLQDSIRHFSSQLGNNEYEQAQREKEIKEIDKGLKNIPNKKEIEEKYIENVRLNIIKLGAWDSAYEGNIKLLKPIKAQGTLENKIILAQFVGLFQTMNYFKTNSIRLPFVVDSPRAKEASVQSSKDILKLIFEIDMLPQVILATMDYSDFENDLNIQAEISVFTEKRKLLNESDYELYKEEIEELFELLKAI
mgnify:CR=1 FL=1